MDSQFSSLRRSAAGLLVLLAVAGAGPVAAGMFNTAGAITDFVFVGGKVSYDTPSVGEMTLELSSENAVQLRVTGADGKTGVFDPESGFSAELKLNATREGNPSAFPGGDFTIFGSIPSADKLSTIENMAGTLDAMQVVDGDAGSLDFLFSGTRTDGTSANEYLSVGIYAQIAGLDEVDWVRAYLEQRDTSVANLNLATREQGLSSPASIPIPATALLILVGLFGLVGYRQRRA